MDQKMFFYFKNIFILKLFLISLFQSVMAAQHFNCVHITLDKLVAESDSKSANKVQCIC